MSAKHIQTASSVPRILVGFNSRQLYAVMKRNRQRVRVIWLALSEQLVESRLQLPPNKRGSIRRRGARTALQMQMTPGWPVAHAPSGCNLRHTGWWGTV